MAPETATGGADGADHASDDVALLRSHRVGSGFAAGLFSRAIRFLTALILARAIILKFGSSPWGILALALAVVELLIVFDFAIHEVCVYEAAASESRRAAQGALDQAVLLALLPSALGTVALLACALGAREGIGFAPGYAGPELTQLFLAAAAGWGFGIVSYVYTGTLQGLGWIRELNSIVLVPIVLDLVIVLAALGAGFGIVGVQWSRALVPPIRLVAVILAVRRLGLPVGRPRRPDWPRLREMLKYSVSYNVNRGLGNAVYTANAPVAQAFVPAATLGAFSAADQWANKIWRFNQVVWESLFHRLVRCLREAATPAEREAGRIQFLATSLGTTLMLVPAGVVLVLASGWLFRAWLDASTAALPAALLPGLVLAWILNSTGSPSTCVIMAANRFRLSATIHAVVVALNVVLTVVLAQQFGIAGVIAAMLVANGLLVLLLSVAACRVVGASWWRWARSNAVPYAVGGALVAWHRHDSSPRVAAAAAALSILASVAIGLRARSLRSFWTLLRPAAQEPVR